MDGFPFYRWRKAHEAEQFVPERFLKEHEKYCVSACARFRELDYAQDHDWVLTFGDMYGASAMILHSRRTVFPIFDGQIAFQFPPHLIRALRNIDIHALHGLAPDTQLLQEVLSPFGFAAKEHTDYHLMALDGGADAVCAAKEPPQGLTLRRAARSDEERIFPLQAAYEQEEVLSQGARFDERLCGLRLSKIIADEKMLVAELDGKIAGKINTNAQSYSRYQLGGVYVLPHYRGRGIGTSMTAAFARLLLAEDKGLTLFAKKTNCRALSMYKKCGFTTIGDYRIAYMQAQSEDRFPS
ncbi:MAG: GNAT family N-acetyltransferase [Spirochaetaceae bacterium]|jgi:ribosomal protein S18 acetylase RimI-like enzyme|nr:GNAT family N-acetyltransferase [Spirochaetaceae bacterium]